MCLLITINPRMSVDFHVWVLLCIVIDRQQKACFKFYSTCGSTTVHVIQDRLVTIRSRGTARKLGSMPR